MGEATRIEPLRNIGAAIQSACTEVSSKVGKEREYDQYSSTVAQTARINEALSKLSDSLRDQTDALEEQCVAETRVYFDELVNLLTKQKKGRFNIRSLRRALDEAEDSIHGCFKNHLAKRVSLDDRECLSILKEPSGADKERHLYAFQKRVIREAQEIMADRVRRIIRDQTDEIDDFCGDIIEQQEKEAESMLCQLEALDIESDRELGDREAGSVGPLALIEACAAAAAQIERGA